jgi:hypothetical protein
VTGRGAKGNRLDEVAVRALCGDEVAKWGLRGKRVLAIVPDHTRTAPIGMMFRLLHEELSAVDAAAFDVLIALGTHPPMSDEAIHQRLGITAAERAGEYGRTKLFNHHWNDPGQLVSIGTITEDVRAFAKGSSARIQLAPRVGPTGRQRWGIRRPPAFTPRRQPC